MNRQILLKGKMKPMLFNTEMVRAILAGRKTVTRRVVKLPHCGYFEHEPPLGIAPPYRPGDILYVRETFWQSPNGEYTYKSDYNQAERLTWCPSIHMPRAASRIFLRVTNVRVERLQDMTIEDSLREGVKLNAKGCVAGENPLLPFERVWDSTIKPKDRDLYGWEANPWVWVIEFERISKEEAEKDA